MDGQPTKTKMLVDNEFLNEIAQEGEIPYAKFITDYDVVLSDTVENDDNEVRKLREDMQTEALTGKHVPPKVVDLLSKANTVDAPRIGSKQMKTLNPRHLDKLNTHHPRHGITVSSNPLEEVMRMNDELNQTQIDRSQYEGLGRGNFNRGKLSVEQQQRRMTEMRDSYLMNMRALQNQQSGKRSNRKGMSLGKGGVDFGNMG